VAKSKPAKASKGKGKGKDKGKDKGEVISARAIIAPYLCFVGLLVVLATTGLWVVDGAQTMRTLYGALGNTQKELDGLWEENSRLQLELSTLSSLQTIEEVAQNDLDMFFPSQFEQVAQ